MAELVVIGGGMAGMLTGLMAAKDGHRVTILERDTMAPPDDVSDAWEVWERRSVRQFHMGHFFLPRFHQVLLAELPELVDELVDAGALHYNFIDSAPAAVTGGHREDDDRYSITSGRRPMFEAVIAKHVERAEGVLVHRGATVVRLLTEDATSVDTTPVHVIGVETDDGRNIHADLVIDTSGRGSALPRLLADAGAAAPVDESEDSGFVYYGRTYRSPSGEVPTAFGGNIHDYESISTLTLAADNGTWFCGIIASGKDREIRGVRDAATFERVWSSYPLVAHWLAGEPIDDGVKVMAGIEDRLRIFVVDGSPVATGIVAIGDSWACTNPSVGRGVSMAIVHAQAFRDQLRQCSLEDRIGFALDWDDRTNRLLRPFYDDTLANDHHRLAQIEASIHGRPFESDDRLHAASDAMPAAMLKDPDVLRVYLDNVCMFTTRKESLDEEMQERVLSLAAGAEPPPGLSRNELLDALNGVRPEPIAD